MADKEVTLEGIDARVTELETVFDKLAAVDKRRVDYRVKLAHEVMRQFHFIEKDNREVATFGRDEFEPMIELARLTIIDAGEEPPA
jgi:hypothetical protein